MKGTAVRRHITASNERCEFGGPIQGLIYEEMGRVDDAEREYTTFLNSWVEADDGLPQVLDA